MSTEAVQTKEQIYDEKISQTVQSVIDLCNEHKISMFMTFHVPSAEDPSLMCTSLVSHEDEEEQYRKMIWSLAAQPEQYNQLEGAS